MRSARDAAAYGAELRRICRFLGISDGNMAEGSMRCDINISLRPAGSTALGTRAEIKNVNSFRFVEKAIQYEIERQADILEDGGTLVQETRLYDAERNETRPMRSKEVANDYRYFPEPDLLPVVIDEAYIEELRATLPELPVAKRDRYERAWGLRRAEADLLSAEREVADYFEAAVAAYGTEDGKPQRVANWLAGELFRLIYAGGEGQDLRRIAEVKVMPAQLAALLARGGCASDRASARASERRWGRASTAGSSADGSHSSPASSGVSSNVKRCVSSSVKLSSASSSGESAGVASASGSSGTASNT